MATEYYRVFIGKRILSQAQTMFKVFKHRYDKSFKSLKCVSCRALKQEWKRQHSILSGCGIAGDARSSEINREVR